MLIDANDNSVTMQDQFIMKLATSYTHCIIVGVSYHFNHLHIKSF
jgi:hypothetical protein